MKVFVNPKVKYQAKIKKLREELKYQKKMFALLSKKCEKLENEKRERAHRSLVGNPIY